METEREGEGRIVWAWQSEGRSEDRVATTECPVSYVSGESMAFLEDFYAHQALGGGEKILEWPARRVDAFALLKAELKKAEHEANGQ